MKIHEYQAKTIFAKYGIPVPKGNVAFSVEGAVQVSQGNRSTSLYYQGPDPCRGPGKGGGVKKAQGINEVEMVAKTSWG